MNDTQIEELQPTLLAWAQGAADLMTRWGFQEHEGFLASESVLILQGYPVAPEDGWEQHFDLHLDNEPLPWAPQEPENDPLVPPPEIGPLTPGQDTPLRLFSTLKYSLPITFIKPLEVSGTVINLIAPKGIARIYTVDVIALIHKGQSLTADEESWLKRSSNRLLYLAGRPWPRRDRWFAKFCTELIDIHSAILAGSPPRPSQMKKFGRRFSVV